VIKPTAAWPPQFAQFAHDLQCPTQSTEIHGRIVGWGTTRDQDIAREFIELQAMFAHRWLTHAMEGDRTPHCATVLPSVSMVPPAGHPATLVIKGYELVLATRHAWPATLMSRSETM